MDSKENSGLSAKLRLGLRSTDHGLDAVAGNRLMAEAADLIDTQASTIAELTRFRDMADGYGKLDAELAVAEANAKRWEDRFWKMDTNFDRATVRAQAAEAKLEAADKALEPFDNFAEFLEVETEGFSDTDRIELFLEESDVLLADVPVSAFRLARTTLADTRGDGK